MELFISTLIVLPLLVLGTAYGFKYLFVPNQVNAADVAQLDEFDAQLVKKYDEVNVNNNRTYTYVAGLAVTTVFLIVLTEIIFEKEPEIFEQVVIEDVAEETSEIKPTKIDPPPPPPEPVSVVQVEAPEDLIEDEPEPDDLPDEEDEPDFDFDNEEEFLDDEGDEEEIEIKVAPKVWGSTEVKAAPVGGMFVLFNQLNQAIMPRIQALGQSYINDLAAGTIQLSFVVNEDGSISELQALSSVDPLVDKIVIEEFAKVAKYTPGMNQGQRVKSRSQFPVVIQF